MEIKQRTVLQSEKDGKLIELSCPADTPLGLLFDALMEFKGFAVQKMADSHKAEESEAEQKMGDPIEVEEPKEV